MSLAKLDPKARWLFHLQALWRLSFFWLPVSLSVGVGMGFLGPVLYAVIAGISLFFLAFVAALWLPALSWARWGYRVDDDELIITHGVLVRRVVAIPTQRIQHVDTRQGPLEQWMGLSRLQVYTASGMGADGFIPGLSGVEAERLRDLLVRLGGDDGV